ncbi:MAG: ABC transporter ATP-binding protein [Dehalobacterium sp.]
MEQLLLKIENLSVCYPGDANQLPALDRVSLSLNRGESLGLIGESGSGKTSLALAVMGLLNLQVRMRGEIFFKGINLQELSEKERNGYRWSEIAMVFQNSLDVLNPVLTVHEQIYECLRKHDPMPLPEAKKKVNRLLDLVGLDSQVQKCYPHQLSGGMRQRVLLAMALSCDPDVLIVDEPTSALDAVAKNEIVALLSRLHREKKFALIVISHEMNIVSALTSKIMVLYSGEVMEEGLTRDVLRNPLHNYTRGLINSSPALNPFRDLWGIPGEKEKYQGVGCPFFSRCSQSIPECGTKRPYLDYVSIERRVACNRGGIIILLKGKNLTKNYRFKGREITACQKCDLEIRSGEVAALIGESGSGKTTLAAILAGILAPDTGEIVFEGKKVSGNQVTRKKKGLQIIFQDPFSSVNEHFTVAQAIEEPLVILKQEGKEQQRERAVKALIDVQLPCDEEFLKRKIHTLSGGQRQRVAIARSLVMEPKLLIADEISSMLDPSTQANIIRLLKGLQNQQGFAMLYVTHDLALAQKIADIVYVMYQGKIIEQGSPTEVFNHPLDNYTKKLINSSQISNLL